MKLYQLTESNWKDCNPSCSLYIGKEKVTRSYFLVANKRILLLFTNMAAVLKLSYVAYHFLFNHCLKVSSKWGYNCGLFQSLFSKQFCETTLRSSLKNRKNLSELMRKYTAFTCLTYVEMNSQFCWARWERDALCGTWLRITWCLLMTHVCLILASVVFQRLLNVCCDYAAEQEIFFNCEKTVGVVFHPKNINSVLHQMFP